MKLKLVTLSLLLLVQLSLASGKEIKIGVSGMVCAFCAQGITKKFKKEAAVESVDVKLSDKRVTLKTRENQDIPDARIMEILTDAGYTVEKIERD